MTTTRIYDDELRGKFGKWYETSFYKVKLGARTRQLRPYYNQRLYYTIYPLRLGTKYYKGTRNTYLADIRRNF